MMRCLDSLYFPQSGFYFIGFVGLAIGLDNQDVGAFESLNPEPCLSFGVLTLRMQGFCMAKSKHGGLDETACGQYT